MEVNILPIPESQKSVLRQMFELYQYDFSEYDQNDINEYGYFGYRYLDNYWTEDTRQAFFIRVDGKLAGFVLVNGYCYLLKGSRAKSIAEFFVMRKYRRRRVGTIAAELIFDKYPGPWEVVQQPANTPAIHFWERVIREYTHGKFRNDMVQSEDWQGLALIFDNTG